MDNIKCCIFENCEKKNNNKNGNYCCKHKKLFG